MIKEKAIRPRGGAYHLTKKNGTEAWFYTNRRSIDLVLYQEATASLVYRLNVSDMKRIVAALSKRKRP